MVAWAHPSPKNPKRHLDRFSLFAAIMLVTNRHTRLTALFLGLPGWAGIRKVKPIRILLKQETVSGTVISCTLLQTDNQTSIPPLSFLQAGCPSFHPTNSVKALKAKTLRQTTLHMQQHVMHRDAAWKYWKGKVVSGLNACHAMPCLIKFQLKFKLGFQCIFIWLAKKCIKFHWNIPLDSENISKSQEITLLPLLESIHALIYWTKHCRQTDAMVSSTAEYKYTGKLSAATGWRRNSTYRIHLCM